MAGLQDLQDGKTPHTCELQKKKKSHNDTDDTSLFSIVPSFPRDHNSRSDNSAITGFEGLSTREAKTQQLGGMRGAYTYLIKLESTLARNTKHVATSTSWPARPIVVFNPNFSFLSLSSWTAGCK